MHDEVGRDAPTVDPSHFRGVHNPYPRHSVSFPRAWDAPEERLLAAETHRYLHAAIEALPPTQRVVITLRDVQGMDAREVCNVLAITETNQRVLLHRARAKVQQALEPYLVKR